MNYGDERLPERFWEKCIPEPNSGCWLWFGCLDKRGYGRFGWAKKVPRSHQVSYLVLVGSIPEGLELDHLCKTQACCNPDHLEPVTHTENMRRAPRTIHIAAAARRLIMTCAQGHPFDGHDGKKRTCSTCLRAFKRAYKARKKLEKLQVQVNK